MDDYPTHHTLIPVFCHCSLCSPNSLYSKGISNKLFVVFRFGYRSVFEAFYWMMSGCIDVGMPLVQILLARLPAELSSCTCSTDHGVGGGQVLAFPLFGEAALLTVACIDVGMPVVQILLARLPAELSSCTCSTDHGVGGGQVLAFPLFGEAALLTVACIDVGMPVVQILLEKYYHDYFTECLSTNIKKKKKKLVIVEYELNEVV
ncbi:hypothetical protein BX666DRAFT_1878940 [Dichotomocladium elegans]|nr:hypothetical protein BX666DRAFT_1878940 [Dichotomocladium elegans]